MAPRHPTQLGLPEAWESGNLSDPTDRKDTMSLTIAGTCELSTVHKSLTLDKHGHSQIDLRKVSFVTPGGLTSIAAIAQSSRNRGDAVTVLAPVSVDVARYLARLRLGRALDVMGATHNLPIVREHEVDTLWEIQSFTSPADVLAFAQHIHDEVERNNGAAAKKIFNGLCEAGENVGHHSGQSTGFLAAQRYSGNHLFFAVADAGKGFLSNLRSRGATSDSNALQLALEPGVSSVNDTSRGYGLSAMAQSLVASRGNLELSSGVGRVKVYRGGSRVLQDTKHSLYGSAVSGSLRI